MSDTFVLRADERGYETILSTGPTAAYVGGHPDAFITRSSSFNFHDYQSGRPGFGKIRVFGDEVFNHPGCSYSMHPHHNFVICAFVLQGQLLHVNTTGQVDSLSAGDFYIFSAGSGGLHTEINLQPEPMHAIYLWLLPDHLLLPPSYGRGHFDPVAGLNRINVLIGNEDGAVPVPQDAKVCRLVSDAPGVYSYRPRSSRHGVYAFVLEGEALIEGTLLGRRDSKAAWGTDGIAVTTGSGSTDILFVETILQ